VGLFIFGSNIAGEFNIVGRDDWKRDAKYSSIFVNLSWQILDILSIPTTEKMDQTKEMPMWQMMQNV